jgi:hypothetical protein
MVKFIKIHVLLAKEIRVTQIRWGASGEIGSAPNASDSNIRRMTVRIRNRAANLVKTREIRFPGNCKREVRSLRLRRI